MEDVCERLQPKSVYELMKTDYDKDIQSIADTAGFDTALCAKKRIFRRKCADRKT